MNVSEEKDELDDPFFRELPVPQTNKEKNKTDNEFDFKNKSSTSSMEEDEIFIPKKLENKIPSELKATLLKVNSLRLTLNKQVKVCKREINIDLKKFD